MIRKIGIGLILFLGMGNFLWAGDFEGEIHLVKKTCYDTSHFIYFVKGDKVRIEEYTDDKRLINAILIDITKSKVYALHPEKKVYRELSAKDQLERQPDKDFVIRKTGNTKDINGMMCEQWRVRSDEKKSEIAYWVANDGFDFFEPVLRMLNNIGNYSDFYLHIPDNDGFLPILAVERNLVRYEKLRMSVTEILKDTLQQSYFEIPSDYNRFDY